MSAVAAPLTREEIGLVAEDIFARAIRPNLRCEDEGQFVAIDAVSGEYEVAATMTDAVARLRARNPAAHPCVMRCDGTPAIRLRSGREQQEFRSCG